MNDGGRHSIQSPIVLTFSESVRANWPAEMSHSPYGEGDFDCQVTDEIQVLNNLLVERMTLDQAATLMGVSTRHTCPRLSQEPFRLVILPSGISIGWRDSIIVRSVQLLLILELSRDFRTP